MAGTLVPTNPASSGITADRIGTRPVTSGSTTDYTSSRHHCGPPSARACASPSAVVRIPWTSMSRPAHRVLMNMRLLAENADELSPAGAVGTDSANPFACLE